MDIVGAIRSAPLVDLGVVFGLCAFFFLGVMQGAIRRILGIIAILFAFLLAANLRDPVGDFLARNWTQFDLGYNRLIAFGGIFAVGTVALSIVIQGFYKRTDISAQHPIIDDVAGGMLGLLQGFLLLTLAVVIFNSYTLPTAQSGDVTLLRQAQDMLIHQSHITGAVRDIVVPPFIHVLSMLLPSDLVSIFP
ncbi:MAG: CvpA family protein [Candidatus Limnocylindrales bacterium]